MPTTSSTTERTDVPLIGTRLRNRRRVLRKTLASVAGEAGVSEGFLSQVERGRASASVATLMRICTVLNMDVGDLFAESKPVTVHRHASATLHRYGENAHKVRVTPTANAQLEAFVAEFDAGGSTGDEPYTHGQSEEMIFVVEGRVEATVGDDTYALDRLDSVTFSSHLPHRVREIGGNRAVVIWAMSPPSF